MQDPDQYSAEPSTHILPNGLSKSHPGTTKSHLQEKATGITQWALHKGSFCTLPKPGIAQLLLSAGKTSWQEAPYKRLPSPLDKVDHQNSHRLNPLWSCVISSTWVQLLVLLAAHVSPGGCLKVGDDFYGPNA